jgi:hypothetical protein
MCLASLRSCAQRPSRTPDDIRNILMSTAKDLGPKNVDAQFGAGLLDPLKALRVVGTAADERARTETQRDAGRGNPRTCGAARREIVTKPAT